MSFDQQLVTAVEYYENKDDYPYSRGLAEHVIAQVDRESETFDFGSTVEKWKGYVLASSILLGAVVVCLFVHNNYVFFSSYFSRLVRPMAAVEPLSSTTLTSLTEDIVARTGSSVEFSADVHGRVPESGKLVLAGVEPNSPNETAVQEYEQIPTRSSQGEQASPRLKASRLFQEEGRFKYRFEAGSAHTAWHTVSICDAPEIKSITAKVSLPAGAKGARAFTEQIENNSLKAIRFSDITLNVQATESLREAVIIGLDGKSITRQLEGADRFSFSFEADRTGPIKFRLIGDQGLINDEIPDVEVKVKVDEAPEFNLISPEGDYLATNVASVPITFEVTDDFGLDSAQIFLEMPGREPKTLEMPVAEGIKTEKISHTVELEQYDLNVGDSILFYAAAGDIDTGSTREQRRSSSDVYFIEIRPYRQNWHPGKGACKGSGPSPPEELLNILEYTRAAVKKTWPIAAKPTLTEPDRSKLKSIDNDIQYCAGELAIIRDDPENEFCEADKAVLNRVLAHYTAASGHLTKRDASSALTEEKDAYRVLRKFISEFEKKWNPPSKGQSTPRPKPDSVKLGKPPEFSHYERERVQGELKQMQRKLKKLTGDQKHLQLELKNFLEQEAQKNTQAEGASSGKRDAKSQNQAKGEGSSSNKGDAKSQSTANAEGSSSGKGDAKSQNEAKGEGSSSGKGSTKSQSTTNAEGSSSGKGDAKTQNAAKSNGSSTGKGNAKSQSTANGEGSSPNKGDGKSQSTAKSENASPGQKPGAGKAATAGKGTGQSRRSGKVVADAEARLKMFQARENALQEQVSQLKRNLEELPTTSDGRETQARQQTQKHLGEALSKMEELQAKLTEARFQANVNNERSADAVELMEEAQRKLDQAGKMLEAGLEMSDEQRAAKEARQMAKQLAADADALDKSLTPLEREQMLARLEAAKRLLKSMSPAQRSTVSKGGDSGASHTLTQNPHTAPAQQAMEMARQFWSIAIDAGRRRTQLTEDELSDVRFYEMENRFFEDTARFNRKQDNR
jgi:hypothetical protein